jgi:hypothetical protein
MVVNVLRWQRSVWLQKQEKVPRLGFIVRRWFQCELMGPIYKKESVLAPEVDAREGLRPLRSMNAWFNAKILMSPFAPKSEVIVRCSLLSAVHAK